MKTTFSPIYSSAWMNEHGHGVDRWRGVTIYALPGAPLTSGQLVEAIDATPGVRVVRTFAVDPPVFLVQAARS